jgi:hypothetical protein
MNKINLPGVKISEKQNHIEKTITWKQLVNSYDLFKRLPFQTDLDEDKVEQMVQSYIKNPSYLVFKNKIVIAVVSTDTNITDYTMYVVDGQHRIQMAYELFTKSNINDYLTICYYRIDSDKKMKELFREINRDSYKNNKYVGLDEFKETLYDQVRDYMREHYSCYFPEKKSPINRRYSLSEFLNKLIEKGLFENQSIGFEQIIEKIESYNKLFNSLIDYQEYYNLSPEVFYKDEQICAKDGIIFSLMNNNFIDGLIDPSVIPDHTFKLMKKSISPKLRIQVWKSEFPNDNVGYCPFYKCENIIRNGLNGFHCGHIISEFNQGPTTLDNLKPICAQCNSKMGTKNWNEYEKEVKRDLRKKKSQDKLAKIKSNENVSNLLSVSVSLI